MVIINSGVKELTTNMEPKILEIQTPSPSHKHENVNFFYFLFFKKLFCYTDIQQEIYFKSKFKLNGLL